MRAAWPTWPTGHPSTTETRFDIGSVSKQFTATAVLLLSIDGALNVHDPISKYVPGLPGWADQITIDQLIHHTSGIPDYVQQLTSKGISYTQPTTQQDALAAIAAVPQLRDTPGRTFDYSNSNYLLLAEVAETASGQTLADLLTDRIFQALSLNMQLHPTLTGPDVATGYWTVNQQLTPLQAQWLQIGDGAIYTTPTEVARWADNYRTGRVGGPRLLAAVTADAVPQSNQPNSLRYGAGIDIFPNGALGHRGYWSGVNSAMAASADRHTTLAISCNSENPDTWGTVAVQLQEIWLN